MRRIELSKKNHLFKINLVVCVVVDEIENVIDNDSNGDDQDFNQLEDERIHYCVAFFLFWIIWYVIKEQ